MRNEAEQLKLTIHQLLNRVETLEYQTSSQAKDLKHLTMLDFLTGLPNKTMLVHELSKTIASVDRFHHKIALLYLGLDDFRRINDSLGHEKGDELLKVVAIRLGESIRDMDSVFRQGGDEFIILLRAIESENALEPIIHRIFSTLQQPVMLGDQELSITTSIGVAFCHSSTMTTDAIIQQADLAMHQAKEEGPGNFKVCNLEMIQRAKNKSMVEKDIKEAIKNGQLSTYFQPITSLEDGTIKGFEALIRWRHPVKGLMMPKDFIPDIENSETIILLGNFVLKQGLEMLKRLFEQGFLDIYVAVNLSARHFLTPELANFIQGLLKHHSISPSRLILEVTEESVIKEVDKALVMMRKLKQLGVRIAIDDFGTGYSSLNYLKQLPFDVLKVDRCFTAGVLENGVDKYIVTTVIELAHNLGRVVVAEGVESEAQRQFLTVISCDMAQGFLFSKALPKDNVIAILSQIKNNGVWPVITDVEQELKLSHS